MAMLAMQTVRCCFSLFKRCGAAFHFLNGVTFQTIFDLALGVGGVLSFARYR
jgi:hypothetical protein